jgi:hypothetical protein
MNKLENVTPKTRKPPSVRFKYKKHGQPFDAAWFMRWVIPEPNSGCWIWDGTINTSGYGTVDFHRKTTNAHRAAYIIFKGQPDAGLVVDHLCRLRCCVNPDHLEAVTQKENCRRRPDQSGTTAKRKLSEQRAERKLFPSKDMRALVKRLPLPGTVWPRHQRDEWLQFMATIFTEIYIEK